MDNLRVVVRFALLLMVCVLISLSAFASNARIVRLSYTEGDVKIDRNIGQGLERGILNMPVTQGARLDTGEDGRVEVEFENGSTMRMTGRGSLVFRELSLTGHGDKVTYVDVQEGLLYFDIKHKGDDDFRVSFGSQNIRLDRNAHFRLDVADLGSSIAVYKGELALEGLEHRVMVKSNETLTIDPEDRNRYFLAKGINADSEDAWDEQRINYLEQYASQQQDYRYANSYYGAPYSYGLSDLSYYGSYFNAPGYGYVWRPYGYGAGWDPFTDGAWSWYPGAGWVFISGQPWGWAPYRYGRWVFVNGYGWAWAPGNNYNYWNPAPVIVNAPRAYIPPAPPRHGGGPTVLVGGGVRTPGPGPAGPPRWPGRTATGTPASTKPGAGGGITGNPRWPGRSIGDATTNRPDGRHTDDRVGARPGSTPTPAPAVRQPMPSPPREVTPKTDVTTAPAGRRMPDVDTSPRRDAPAAPPRDVAPPPRMTAPDTGRGTSPPPRIAAPDPGRDMSPPPAPSPRMSAPESPRSAPAPSPRMSAPQFRSSPPSSPSFRTSTPRFSSGQMGGHGGGRIR